jgi:uncharacterized membrane protein
MIALAGLVRLPMRAIFLVGVAIVAGHNLLDGIRLTPESTFYIPWAILHQRDVFELAGKTIRTSYPVLPWMGVMALGYCASAFYSTEWTARKRQAAFKHLGLALLCGFVVLRVLNIYGDASPFTEFYADPTLTLFSVFNTTKYPPSLLFVMMTLATMLLLLAWAEQWQGRAASMLSNYGRAPLFFYVAHWTLLHILALAAAIIAGTMPGEFDFARYFAGLPRPLDFSLAGVYAMAGAAVALLYWPCGAVGRLKTRHPTVGSFI